MATLSAAGLEALTNQYIEGADVGAADLSGDYRAAAMLEAQRTAEAQNNLNAALAQQEAQRNAGYAAISQQADRLKGIGVTDNTNVAVPSVPETQTSELMRRNALLNMQGSVLGAKTQAGIDAELLKQVGLSGIGAQAAQLAAAREGAYASAQGYENQAGAQRELSALGIMGTAKANAANAKASEDSLTLQRQQADVSNALKELNTFGKIMTKGASDALGVPIGTTKNSFKSGSGSGKSKSKVVNFNGAWYADGTPVRKEYLYQNEDDFNLELENAVSTGSDVNVLHTLQSGIYDGLVTPEQAQTAYDAFREKNTTKRYKYGDY
ncbi:MAG: hypothetical protein IJD14_04885 [Christensenellaceae bacterium]|nr:hypothetical protein [Christensenellaceae bacterium]